MEQGDGRREEGMEVLPSYCLRSLRHYEARGENDSLARKDLTTQNSAEKVSQIGPIPLTYLES